MLRPDPELAPTAVLAPDGEFAELPPELVLAPSELLAPDQPPPASTPTELPWPGPGVAPNSGLAPDASLAPSAAAVVAPTPPPLPVAPALVRVAPLVSPLATTIAPTDLPRTPGFSFGCEDYSVWLFLRGGETRVGLLQNWSHISFQYVRNGVSQAQVIIPNIANVDPECCAMISTLQNWQMELAINRGGTGEVWVGPLVQRPITNGSLTLTAYDMGKWLSKRWIHKPYNLKGVEALQMFSTLWHDAIDPDNSMNVELLTGFPTKTILDFQYAPSTQGRQTADQALSQAVSSAVDYYTIRRFYIAGAPSLTLASNIQLVDEFVVGVPDTDADGSVQANNLAMTGQTRGNQPITVERNAAASLRSRDGLLETVVTDQSLQTRGAVSQIAAALIGLLSDSPATVSQLRLAPQCPYRLADLQPGGLLDVRLARTCQTVIGIYRIQQLDVTVDASSESGAEVPMLTLQYVAPTMADVDALEAV